MKLDNMASNGPIRRLRLRKPDKPTIPDSPEELIQKNLQPLLHYTEKKKRAQEMYYEKQEDKKFTSPLLRTARPSVRQRLGGITPFIGTNTSVIPPKRRIFKRNGTLNNIINLRKNKGVYNSAQQRLNKIRERQRESTQLNQTNRIKLVRRASTPLNLKVKVANNQVYIPKRQIVNNLAVTPQRFKIVLNHEIQALIQQLQQVPRSFEPILDIKPKAVATHISINDRFTSMSELLI